MEAVIAIAVETGAAALQPERADAWILELIARHVDSELTAYDLIDGFSRPVFGTEFPVSTATPGDDLAPSDNPFCAYRKRADDPFFSARRLSDVQRPGEDRRTKSEIADEPAHCIQMRMPGELATHWVLEVARNGPDYSERDLAFIDMLRPFLMAHEAHRVLAAKVAELRAVRWHSVRDGTLSARENAVLDLVAEGASNAESAHRMHIAPGTVKKHLENIDAKLDVGSRTAAVAQTMRLAVGPESHPGVSGPH